MSLFLKEECFESEKFPKISKVVKYFKKDEKGAQNMCTIVEEYAKEYAEEVAKEERLEEIKEVAKKLIARGDSDEDIIGLTSLSMEEVAKLRNQE